MSEGIFKLNPWKNMMLSGIILLLLGLLMAVFQKDSLEIILILSGAFCILVGVVSLYGAWKVHAVGIAMVPGIIYTILGLVLVLAPGLVSDILMALLAAGLIVIGAVSLLNTYKGFTGNVLTHVLDILIAVIMIGLGIYALFNLDDAADIVMIVIGAMVAVTGVMRMYDAYILKQLDV